MASSLAKPAALPPLHSRLSEFPLIGSSSIRPTSKDPHFSHFDVTLKRTKNAPIVPKISARSSPDYIPDANFYKVEAILSCNLALLKMGIRGVTVSDVRGFGAQGGLTERQAGSEFSEDNLVAKVKMEIVVSKDQVEAVIDKIIAEARTGEIGDGKIFLVPVSDVIRVRTGERGEKAERMVGGRSDMSSSVSPA
ncbi:hypothetical protein RJ640_021691 [Escallonia rubra]|uniref:PII protein n=1 Tax=Escallonia rubra TaxID=112253 RepID=A0AA88R4T9_9ASTE|nr:hypothetical protein RJ640_021691 [Escallonia rubra]